MTVVPTGPWPGWPLEPQTTLNDLAEAVLFRWRTVPHMDVFDAVVGTRTPGQPYGVLYPETGFLYPDRLGSVAGGQQWAASLLIAGEAPDQVRAAVERTRSVLTGWRPIAVASCSRLREGASGTLLLDEKSSHDARFSQTIRYTCHLERRPA